MKFSLVLGQRLPFAEMLARTREAEMLGFDGLFLVDHFFGRVDINEPTHEGYTMLAALAPFTTRLRLGLMVAGNTYRNPFFLLKQALTVDHISGGRVDFGVGAGWVEREHEAYSYEFPAPKERVDRFAEALEIWDSLQTNAYTNYSGSYYTLVDAPCEPKSLQGKLPVLIGGSKPRMLRLTARYADIWNCTSSPEVGAELNLQLNAACVAEGRDPGSIERSVSPDMNMLESVEAFASGARVYQDAGFSHIYLPWPRVESEAPVMRAAASEILRTTNAEPAPYAPSPRDRGLRSVTQANRETWSPIVARFAGTPPARCLQVLSDSPETLFDGNDIAREAGLTSHVEVSQAFAELGDALEAAGFARPWLEGPRGRTLSSDSAAAVKGKTQCQE